MAIKRAEDRKFHYTYKVTCSYNGRVFCGLHSSDTLDDSFIGSGHSLSISKSEYGDAQHMFSRIQLYPTRAEAKIAYNLLKASQLANPIRPEDKKFHFVYKTTRFDGKYYIGVHSTDDLNDGYKGSGTHLIRSLKKHGWDKHKREILYLCETRDAAFEKEKEVVTEELLKDSLCMNSIAGGRQHGNRVYGVTDETRQKLSIASKAVIRTPEWCAKIGKGNRKPKPRSEEGDKAWRAANVGRKQKPEHVAARTAGQLSSEKFKKRYRPMIVNGVTYQNGREAVAALGIPGGTLNNRLISPNWLDYRFADQPEKDPCKVTRARAAKPCLLRNSVQ